MDEDTSMRSVVIANVGNSDLGNGEETYFDIRNDNIYEKSKELYENKNFDFDAILLEPLVEELIKEYEIERIFLFATEQQPVNQKDTIYTARIIKEILIKKFNINNIEIIQVHDNPSDYDEMLRFYEREIGKIPTSADVVHISITGGTPAQNTAMLIRSLLKFGNIVQAVYKPMGTRETKKFKIGEEISRILLSEQLRVLNEKHLYGAAAELAEKYNLLRQREIYRLKAKEHRSQFDFEDSIKNLEKALTAASGEEKAIIKKEIEEIERLKGGLKGNELLGEEYFLKYRALIRELYTNMKQKWEQAAYADFLGRLFRFEEALLRYVFEKETKAVTEKSKGGHEDFERHVKSDNELLNFLEGKGIKLERLEPNRMVLRLILEFWVREKGIGKLGQIYRFVDKINKPEDDSLADLRNKSILAHGFEGISKQDFEKYGDILEDIDIIVKKL